MWQKEKYMQTYLLIILYTGENVIALVDFVEFQ